MRVSDKAFVLQSVRHKDNKYILKLFTREHGSITVLARTGKSPSSKIKPAAVLPLNFIEVELVIKQNKELHQLHEAGCYNIHTGLHDALPKLAIVQFLNEMLVKSLKEHTANSDLYEFIETCFQYLNDVNENYLNFHLYFLGEFTKYLGFEPQNNYSSVNRFFDCREGIFSTHSLPFPLGLDKDESFLFSEFLKLNTSDAFWSGTQRRKILEALIAYYSFHLPAFGEVKSLEVLREVMSS
jgi:DNA repair protein RecO (recombination protein O)